MYSVVNTVCMTKDLDDTFEPVIRVRAVTYKTLQNIVMPDKPGDKTYAALVEALSKHFKPKPSEIIECFKFHS